MTHRWCVRAAMTEHRRDARIDSRRGKMAVFLFYPKGIEESGREGRTGGASEPVDLTASSR